MELWPLQKKIVDELKHHTNAALFMDVGTGKSCTLLSLIKPHIECNIISKVLIVGPSVVVPNWPKEVKNVMPLCKIPVHASFGSGVKRKKELQNFVENNPDKGIIVINYDVATSSLGPIIEKFKPDTLVFDESHLLKNHKSKRSKFFYKMREKAERCYILTGTPVSNSITDIWMQYMCMDKGATFGTNFFTFQKKYMRDSNASWIGQPGYFPKWEIRENRLPEFKQLLSKSSVTVTRDEMLDIPDLTVENYYVSLNKEQLKAYKELSKLMITQIKEEMLTVENALTKILRLNQICAGHLPTPEGEIYSFKDLEKTKVLQNIVQKIVEKGDKTIIWTNFKHDVKTITKALHDIGIENIVYITGSQSSKEKQESENTFQTTPGCKILVANYAAANAGINLQQASHSINWSRGFSFTHAYQSEARNRRGGSDIHKRIIQHNLITHDTIEEEIVDIIETKRSLGDFVLSNIDNMKKMTEFDKESKRKLLENFLNGRI